MTIGFATPAHIPTPPVCPGAPVKGPQTRSPTHKTATGYIQGNDPVRRALFGSDDKATRAAVSTLLKNG